MTSKRLNTPIFTHLATFSLGNRRAVSVPSSPLATSFRLADEPTSPIDDLEIEPDLDGMRHLSVSTDASTESRDEAITPPHSPTFDEGEEISIFISNKRSRGSDFDEDTFSSKAGRIDMTTPPKASPLSVPEAVTPADSSYLVSPFFVTPPTPPRMRSTSGESVDNSPSRGVAARRAAAGKLPTRALASLQKMRIEAHDAGLGLGVGPASPGGYESPVELDSPGPGMTFRLALGLERNNSDDSFSDASTPTATTAPKLWRSSSSSTSIISCRRMPRSPGAVPFEGKFPPSPRGPTSMSLSPTSALSSPLSSSPRDRSPLRCPPSPLVARSSAYSLYNQGPLTPLTPSRIPGAPDLDSSSGFDYFFPQSPATPNFTYTVLEPAASSNFFLPTPPSSDGKQGLYRTTSLQPTPTSPLSSKSF